MTLQTKDYWSTYDELRFIASLPHASIAGYLAGARNRKDWGSIDRWKVLRAAEKRFREGSN